MPDTPRPDVAKALKAAGWTVAKGVMTTALRHPSGATLAPFGITGCFLTCLHPEGGSTDVQFTGGIPDAVVIAACLAASGQLNAVQDMQRSEWLGWLEAAGVDNWEGESVAIDLRDEHEREQQ